MKHFHKEYETWFLIMVLMIGAIFLIVYGSTRDSEEDKAYPILMIVFGVILLFCATIFMALELDTV